MGCRVTGSFSPIFLAGRYTITSVMLAKVERGEAVMSASDAPACLALHAM